MYCEKGETTVNGNGETELQKPKKKRLYIKIIAVILAVIIALGGCTCALVYFDIADIPFVSKLLKLDENNGEFNSITGKFTDVLIVDENSAISAAKEAAKQMGLKNAADELTAKNVTSTDGMVYYRLQQNYQGLSVNGKTIIVVADENGNAKSAFSNMSDVKIKNVDKELDEEKIIAKASSFLDVSADDVKLISYDKTIINGNRLYVAYDTYVSCGGTTYNLYIPVGKQKITYHSSNLNPAEICKSSNGMTFNGIKVTEKNVISETAKYILYDYDEKIYCLNAGGRETYSYKTHSDVKNSAKKISKNKSNNFGKRAETAFVAYDSLKKIKDYYVEEFNDYGYNGLTIIINSGTGTVGGKLLVSNFDDLQLANYSGEYIGCVQVGKDSPDDAADLKTMGHEYTHVITSNKVDWDYRVGEAAEASCINEAYSDLFGMIIEAKLNNTPNELSWNYRADAKTLDNGLYPSEVNSYETFTKDVTVGGGSAKIKNCTCVWLDKSANEWKGFSYAYAVTLEHAAYLMTESGTEEGNLTISELSSLWYNTMCTLHSNANFSELRSNMEKTADNLGYSEAKKQCISKAFDKIGVESKNVNNIEIDKLIDNKIDDVEQNNSLTVYDEVLNQYKIAIKDGLGYSENLDSIGDFVNNLLLLSSQYSNNFKVYYALADINNDGNYELIIGAGADDVIGKYDIFTNDGEKSIPLLPIGEYGERNYFELYDNGIIYTSGAGGATHHSYEYFKLPKESTALEFIDGYSFEDYNYYKTDKDFNLLAQITESDVENIISQYETQELNLEWIEIVPDSSTPALSVNYEIMDYYDLNAYEFAEKFNLEIFKGYKGVATAGATGEVLDDGRYSISITGFEEELTTKAGDFCVNIGSIRYSLYGIKRGMGIDECIEKLNSNGFELSDEDEIGQEFLTFYNSEGDYVDLTVHLERCQSISYVPQRT